MVESGEESLGVQRNIVDHSYAKIFRMTMIGLTKSIWIVEAHRSALVRGFLRFLGED